MFMLEEFRDVYGMRFVGLEDPLPGPVYTTYRVPDPEAPYPQDYVIDQEGIVRYWSWEYDPQEVIATIDELLGVGVGIADPAAAPEPARLRLATSPNPFRAGTEIRFRLPVPEVIRLTVTDVTGRRIRTLARGGRAAGAHAVAWDGRDETGRRVAGGVYFVELAAGDVRAASRVLLLR
jgi:hypothetical protein